MLQDSQHLDSLHGIAFDGEEEIGQGTDSLLEANQCYCVSDRLFIRLITEVQTASPRTESFGRMSSSAERNHRWSLTKDPLGLGELLEEELDIRRNR